jgi:hypothetical protein
MRLKHIVHQNRLRKVRIWTVVNPLSSANVAPLARSDVVGHEADVWVAFGKVVHLLEAAATYEDLDELFLTLIVGSGEILHFICTEALNRAYEYSS